MTLGNLLNLLRPRLTTFNIYLSFCEYSCMLMAGTELFEGFAICLLHPHPFSAPQKSFSCFNQLPALLTSVFLCLTWVVWGSLWNLPYSGPGSHFNLKIYGYLAPEEAKYQWRPKTENSIYDNQCLFNQNYWNRTKVTQWWA